MQLYTVIQMSQTEASQYDIDCCNVLGVPYYIFSYPNMELNIIEPETKAYPLIGREYEFGELIVLCHRDYLKSKGVEIPPRIPFEDNWWDREIGLFF